VGEHLTKMVTLFKRRIKLLISSKHAFLVSEKTSSNYPFL
jgi:hypothetical protein